jgi:hypothetical protein
MVGTVRYGKFLRTKITSVFVFDLFLSVLWIWIKYKGTLYRTILGSEPVYRTILGSEPVYRRVDENGTRLGNQ